MKTPTIESERLILRPLKWTDGEAVFYGWTSDPEVARYMSWSQHQNISETLEWLALEEQHLEDPYHYNFGFVLKSTGDLIGCGGIHLSSEKQLFELGYNIMQKHWRKGLASEAARRIMDFAIQDLNIKHFFSRHDQNNIASRKIIEKLGFIYSNDATFRSIKGDKTYYGPEYYLEV